MIAIRPTKEKKRKNPHRSATLRLPFLITFASHRNYLQRDLPASLRVIQLHLQNA